MQISCTVEDATDGRQIESAALSGARVLIFMQVKIHGAFNGVSARERHLWLLSRHVKHIPIIFTAGLYAATAVKCISSH